ncbi:polyphosphate polymerase domain-containing protein [Oceanobacter kriegii]|uniref:polyphosphate polymerase domain-containing protein n=1 Tax=Oceanobacter kriegii TaxID=64972 RepID=UPI000405EA70|nr:polyphosphate polymerase domain-containing protein [Oceanobacter kriegii]
MSQTLSVKRHEVKFFISHADYEYARNLLATLMDRDPNQTHDRGYFIRSLYFDDILDSSVEDKLDGIELRDKYRIRVYSPDQQWAKLERKRKHNQFVDKSSVTISREQALQMIDGDYDFLLDIDSNSARSIFFDLKRKYFRPTVMVDYDREVYLMDYNDIRVTFDMNLRVNTEDFDLFSDQLQMETLQRFDTIIMEVKFNHCLPSWFPQLFNLNGTNAQAISKYCLGRMHMREFYSG